MQLYGALAHLYPLFSPREDYVEEAEVIGRLLHEAAPGPRADPLLGETCA